MYIALSLNFAAITRGNCFGGVGTKRNLLCRTAVVKANVGGVAVRRDAIIAVLRLPISVL